MNDGHRQECFFEENFSSIIYMIFIVIIPVIAVFLQLFYNDKTLYLSLFTVGFAITYDHIVLLSKNIGKRLWIEAIVSILSVLATSAIGFLGTIRNIEAVGQAITYTYSDLAQSLVLTVPVTISFIEFSAFLKSDYRTRYRGNTCQAKVTQGGIALRDGGKPI